MLHLKRLSRSIALLLSSLCPSTSLLSSILITYLLQPPTPLTSLSFINFYPLHFPTSLPPFHLTTGYSSHNMVHPLVPTSSLFSFNTRCFRLVFTLPFSLSPTSCSYLRLCKEWLDLRLAATDAAPLSPMTFSSRLHYIIQSEHIYVLMKRLNMNHMLTCMETCTVHGLTSIH